MINETLLEQWQNTKIENDKLQQENKQLKDKINTYENPEDLTLMFMYCDEKAKDKIKQLKEVIDELNEALNHIDDNIMETCEVYDVNGIELKKILDKVKEN